MHAIKAKFTHNEELITVNWPGIRYPFYLRCRTSDLPTFDQVFIRQDYVFDVEKTPAVIVDAGANIGLASIYFASKFPDSHIIAIEPEASNFDMLKKNVAPYSNITPVNAALWNRNEEINLVDPGLGKWGFMTQGENYKEEGLGRVTHRVQGMTIDKIMDDNHLEKIDILKLDIEGAEREVFIDSSSWINKVNALIIELHERMKSGCNRTFYKNSEGFDNEWQYGENIYLSRGNCLKKRAKNPLRNQLN